MRGLRKSIKCMLCPHKKVCHDELGEVERLRGIIEELTYEVDEYEKELQRVQHERIRLIDEVSRLEAKLQKEGTPKVDVLSKANVKQVCETYVTQVGCKTCIGCGTCHLEDETACAETIYKLLENHFKK